MTSARLAAIVWIMGATVYLGSEAVSAARAGGYSYAGDFISDLGVVPVMNIGGFIVHGVLFLVGALVIAGAGAWGSGVGRAFVASATANMVGNVMVGLFHSGTAQAQWHVLGAGLAILGGNAAVITGGIGSRAFGAGHGFRRASIVLGSFGIICLVVLIADAADGSHALPPGVVERGSVYPIIAWELLAAAALIVRGADARRS
ncbi:DUF998 domain-containing protein [Mycobacterium sp. 236(2023)]|uniref:DUF998 domain-containing protein n=1 Tax=Mycobacterium sp. 236(2023) TaxID=3038163 RepID=UPI002414FF1A|nr:DUF998 domain-containing protein [Mycobacterium sp. 236(2023)]MDG4664525.1 DUF998 domain-containing protein [Mycobacterium sp. 236(2023)]